MSSGPFREMTAEQIAAMSKRNRASRTHRFPVDTKVAKPSPGRATERSGKASKVSKARLQTPTEHEEQRALVEWFDTVCAPQHNLDHRMLFAIPNGGDRHPAVAAKLKVEGVRAGVPDLMLAIPERWIPDHSAGIPGAGLFLEMKRTGIKSAKAGQEEYHALLRAQGYRVVVCAGFEAARDCILEYLGV